jgi:TldD protein
MTEATDAKDLAALALEAVRRTDGVEYVDARVVSEERENLHLRDGRVDRLVSGQSAGVGVRVLYRGAWGFGAHPGHGSEAAEVAARAALETAKAAAQIAKERVRLVEEEPAVGSFRTPIAKDPFAVPLEQKLADLTAALTVLEGSPRDAARVLTTHARMLWRRTKKYFASTEGAACDQTLVFGGAGLQIVAQDGDEIAVRSWPMDMDGGVLGRGYETVAHLELGANAARIREEAFALLSAPPCPATRTTLVLDTPQLSLQIHESCGHPTEADRALGEEISLAGGSFLSPDKLGRFTYGNKRVNLTADSTLDGGLGTFGWDDEGVAARRTPLVSRGIFVGYLSSRETAQRMNLGRSAGCMRAESWSRPAIIRMINVSLEPDPRGPSSLGELVADTRDGVLMTTNRSWSIDDLRLNFQFGCEAAWEIKGGRLGRILKKPLYTGITPKFWAGCQTIGNQDAFRVWGYTSCGKGDPMQLMAVGHGCAPARFADVEIGSTAGIP